MNLFDHASNVTVVQWGVALGASLAAALTDLGSRRIPNSLTAPLAATGLLYALTYDGLGGLGQAVGACVFLALPYVLLFFFAGGGAGDAKLMGALGAWLGLGAGVVVLVTVAVTGVVLGLVNLATKRQLGAGLRRIGAAFYVMLVALCSGRKGWALVKPDSEEVANSSAVEVKTAMPYGPAIFLGVCIAAYVVHTRTG